MSSTSTSLGYYRLTLEKTPARSGSPITWGDLVARWRQYILEKAQQYLVFVGDGLANSGEILSVPYSHRFTQEYTRMQYSKIQGFVRGALSEYENPHFVFLTFSTTTLEAGRPRPPLDHMEELLDPWNEGVYYELKQVMEGDRKKDPWEPKEWEYLYILEPTTDAGRVPGGYAHAHCALVVDGEVDSGRFESVIDRHLQECPGAMGEAHEFDDSIVVKEAAKLNNPGAYLFKYLGKSWNVNEMEDYEKRFAALLFDQKRQRFRASNGAQRWMQYDELENEHKSWIYGGVASDKQVEELSKYDSLEEFQLAKESGLGGWLRKLESFGGSEPEPLPERNTTEEEYYMREKVGMLMPWEYTDRQGDRPPPNTTFAD